MQIIQLDNTFAEDICLLSESRSNFSSVADSRVLESIRIQQRLNTYNVLTPAVIESGLAKVFGYFEDNELKGVLFTSPSSYQVSYYLTRAHTKLGVTNGIQILSSLFVQAIKVYEEAGYLRFSTLYEADSISKIQRLWKFKTLLPEYYSYTELEMGPNEKPKQQEIWETLYGQTLYPEATVVRTFIRIDDVSKIQ